MSLVNEIRRYKRVQGAQFGRGFQSTKERQRVAWWIRLRLALSGVPAPRAQPEKTADLATLREPMRIFQGQDIRQRDLCPYPLHLFEQRDLRVALRGDFLHPRVVFLDALVQRFDFCQQRLQGLSQLHTQFRGQLPAHLPRATLAQPFAI
ncbi:MAG: hypothetical protein AUH01_04330 [Acidobacteria bacterium 13_2_20CM_56_17]|nr:MAG: hypothetical protein AUH01_04330 [Acidobacteria bacterium 13_2_20CM_56_17]